MMPRQAAKVPIRGPIESFPKSAVSEAEPSADVITLPDAGRRSSEMREVKPPVQWSAPDGTRTRLTCSTGRPPRPLRPGAVGPATRAGRARTEGVEPSASRLELDCSPGSTSLSAVLRPGLEPGTRTSRTRVMSVSPSKRRQYPGQESNLGLDLRRVA